MRVTVVVLVVVIIVLIIVTVAYSDRLLVAGKVLSVLVGSNMFLACWSAGKSVLLGLRHDRSLNAAAVSAAR